MNIQIVYPTDTKLLVLFLFTSIFLVEYKAKALNFTYVILIKDILAKLLLTSQLSEQKLTLIRHFH